MIRKLPILPTLVVLIAAAIMVRLGVWQIARLHEKETMIARFEAVEADRAVHRWPSGDVAPLGYTRLQLDCRADGAAKAEAGRNASGQAGWAQVAGCTTPEGGKARVVLGWSSRPEPVSWSGGVVTGTLLPRDNEVIVVADPPLAGLAANARPDPRDLPNNHLAYAVQWFAFAAIALVIYGLALAKRNKG
jgi:surfeit locus 1 family protein